MILNSSVSFVMSFGPPFLQISPGMTSAPGALPFRSLFVAFRTSSSLIVLTRVMLGTACGRRAMAASFIDEGQFKTLLKCSAQRFRILSLSVYSVLPSVLSTGNDPDDCGP